MGALHRHRAVWWFGGDAAEVGMELRSKLRGLSESLLRLVPLGNVLQISVDICDMCI
jgi:hypothetical protein